MEALIAASAVGKLPQEALWIGAPAELTMFDSTYKATMQSGIASLFDYNEQKAYANLYAAFQLYWQQAVDEALIWGDLRTLEDHPSPSATLDWQLRSAIKRARLDRTAIYLMRSYALRDAAAIGVTPTNEGKIKATSVCVPLHTPRSEGEKLSEASLPLNVPHP